MPHSTHLKSSSLAITTCLKLSGFNSKLRETVLEQSGIVREIKAILDSGSINDEEEDQISQEEMLFLMATGEEEDAGGKTEKKP